jgi:5'-3' exonuclease
MGVPGFFAWLLKNKKKLGSKKLIKTKLDTNIKYLMLDTNCLLHPCVNNILEKYKTGILQLEPNKSIREQLEHHIWILIENYILDMINKVKPEFLYIGIDGVAPIGKILQQRQRRYRYLYDKSIKLNKNSSTLVSEKLNGIVEPIIPITSIELTPGTDYMERIHNNMINFMTQIEKQGIRTIYSSYHEEGEGEHKILQYIKKKLKPVDSVIIYGLDTDLLFLSLGIGTDRDLYIMREAQVFNGKEVDLDEYPEYNYVEIKELHRFIENLDISTPDFIMLSYMIGNDFLPGMLTLDVKKGGLDKIFEAFHKVLEKQKIPIRINGFITDKLVIKEANELNINHSLLIDILKELVWTEKYIWKNINRDPFISQRDIPFDEIEARKIKAEENKKNSILKFISGLTDNTDCLTKIEFNSSNEYYSYYLGIECLDIDKNIISKMVKDYITGLNWCLNYYLNECGSWSWGYNFLVAPVLTDIIKYYPKKIGYKKTQRELNPVEQLILAIPPDTYKYVIESDIIKLIQSNKKIGYMFPLSYDLDINTQSKMWKCQVKIPMVEYDEYLTEIKKINILNNKNL